MKFILMVLSLSLGISAYAAPAKSTRGFECGETGDKFKIVGLIKANHDLKDVQVLQANYLKRTYEVVATKKLVKLSTRRMMKNRSWKFKRFYTFEFGGGWDSYISVHLTPYSDTIDSADISVESAQGETSEISLTCGPTLII